MTSAGIISYFVIMCINNMADTYIYSIPLMVLIIGYLNIKMIIADGAKSYYWRDYSLYKNVKYVKYNNRQYDS